MPTCLVEPTDHAIPVEVVFEADFSAWLEGQDARVKAWLQGAGFEGVGGKAVLIPAPDGAVGRVVYVPGGEDGSLESWDGPWAWAGLYGQLPKGGVFAIASDLSADQANACALGFALADYRFDHYHTQSISEKSGDSENTPKGTTLVWPVGADQAYVRAAHGAAKLARDLINTPASDMGPADLARAAEELAEASGAVYSDIVGVDLIREGFPAIYAVGRGAEEGRAPRLIDFNWSKQGGREDAPKVTLVGKGVCFDTGGLDIKSTAGMKLMKKDMGGAAQALALASMIMAMGLDVRLRVLVAAVENSVSATAMRPLDVIATRKGLSLEIGNTDAEGRVILADALALASEDAPDLILDFATLTGAARVALGTELPALFCNNDELAAAIERAGREMADPVWRLPLWAPYAKQTKSKVADLRNDTDSPYAGAIMAALFLEKFVAPDIAWAHLDLMGWNVSAQPGRPEGGEAMAVRAVFAMLQNRFGN